MVWVPEEIEEGNHDLFHFLQCPNESAHSARPADLAVAALVPLSEGRIARILEKRAQWLANTIACPICHRRIDRDENDAADHASRHCRLGCWRPFRSAEDRVGHELDHVLRTVGLSEMPFARFERLLAILKALGGDVFAPALQGLLAKELKSFGVTVRRERGVGHSCIRCGVVMKPGTWILETSAGWRHVLCPSSPQILGSSKS